MFKNQTAWGDYDGDSDPDLLVTGCTTAVPCSNPVTKVYRNDGGDSSGWRFTEIKANLPGVYESIVAWEDFDQDGDADLLLAGCTDSLCTRPITQLYQSNPENLFSELDSSLVGVYRGSAAWGDYDGDHHLDLFLTGDSRQGSVSHLYHNDGSGAFTPAKINLAAVYDSSATWGDYDADNDPDILLTGYTTAGSVLKIYRNDGPGNSGGVK